MPETTRNGVRLHYEDVGEGPAVLFHAGGCGDHRMWELAGYTKSLPGTRQLLLDHRGHGASDCPTELEAHRLDEYASDAIAVFDAAEVERAAFIGYSAGATIGFRAAAQHPERFLAVVGIGGVSLPNEDFSDWKPLIETVRAEGTRATIEAMAAAESEPAPTWLVDHLSTTSPEMFALLMEAWLTAPSEWKSFVRITAPTLFICGEHEDSEGEAALAAVTVRDGEARLLPGYGHLQTFWHAEVTAPVIRDFVSRRCGTGASR